MPGAIGRSARPSSHLRQRRTAERLVEAATRIHACRSLPGPQDKAPETLYVDQPLFCQPVVRRELANRRRQAFVLTCEAGK